jgi:hypothetical protein
VRERAGSYSLALRETSRGRTIAATAGEESEPVLARLFADTAFIRARQSHAEQARQDGATAAVLARRCGEHAALARASHAIFQAEVMLGAETMAGWAHRALELYEQIGDLEGQAHMASNLGALAYFDSDWHASIELYRQAIEADRRIGNLLDAAMTQPNRCCVTP